MGERHAVVAACNTHTEVEVAINALKQAAFNVKKLSIVEKDYRTDKHVVGYYNTGDDHMKCWGTAISGSGTVLLVGPLLRWILDALEETVVIGAAMAIGAALNNLGIPKDSVLNYETVLKSHKFILLAHGTEEEVTHAQGVIQTKRSRSIDTHAIVDREARAVA
ncbi:MAG: hypothetical protein JNL29_18090 [Nitrospira sp.]|nr:hypothetical protein [Nitrospira sp.]